MNHSTYILAIYYQLLDGLTADKLALEHGIDSIRSTHLIIYGSHLLGRIGRMDLVVLSFMPKVLTSDTTTRGRQCRSWLERFHEFLNNLA